MHKVGWAASLIFPKEYVVLQLCSSSLMAFPPLSYLLSVHFAHWFTLAMKTALTLWPRSCCSQFWDNTKSIQLD